MKEWAEVGILRQNAAGGVGPLPSVNSGFILATSGDNAVLDQYLAWQKQRKQDKITGIGEPITITLIAGIVLKALAAATALLIAINETKRLNIQAQAQGFGTPAFSADRGDFTAQATGSGGGISPMLLLGGAAALYFITNDKK
jgi:hypothetical protein